MKKMISALLTAGVMMGVLVGCAVTRTPGGNTQTAVTIDYGTSAIYTKEDMDEAIALIRDKFSGWEGCELHSIQYASDQCYNLSNIVWMNELKEGASFTQVIKFVSDFHSPKEGGGAWVPDKEYTGWQWWLAREDGGAWELMTWGY